MIRLAAIGAAATGKSALLNSVFGTSFAVDARAGTTSFAHDEVVHWHGRELRVTDTPPLGSAWVRADAYLLVCDKDLTDAEYTAVLRAARPLGVALNKADQYNAAQLRQLLAQLRKRLTGVILPGRIVACAADPVRAIFREGEVRYHPGSPQIEDVRRLLDEVVLEAERSARVRAREFAQSLFRR